MPFLVVAGDQAAWPRAQSDGGVHPLLVVLGPVGRGQAEVDWCCGQGDINRITFWILYFSRFTMTKQILQ